MGGCEVRTRDLKSNVSSGLLPSQNRRSGGLGREGKKEGEVNNEVYLLYNHHASLMAQYCCGNVHVTGIRLHYWLTPVQFQVIKDVIYRDETTEIFGSEFSQVQSCLRDPMDPIRVIHPSVTGRSVSSLVSLCSGTCVVLYFPIYGPLPRHPKAH